MRNLQGFLRTNSACFTYIERIGEILESEFRVNLP